MCGAKTVSDGAGLFLELSCTFEGLQDCTETRVGRKSRGRQQLSHLVSLELGLCFCLLLCMYLFLVWLVAHPPVKTDGSFVDEPV